MTIQTKPIIALALSAIFAHGCTAPMNDQTEPPTVLITRHAEKESYSADPSLSLEGANRAYALSELPQTQSVRFIITTQFRRTIETAQPTAENRGILSRVVNATARPDDLRSLADEIRDSAQHGTVLVVGHSNTVPLIIAELGGPRDIHLTEEDFGDLFILTLDENGAVAGTERIRYGD